MTDKAEVKRLKGELEACHRAWVDMDEKLTKATNELARLHHEVSRTSENHAYQLAAYAKLLADARQQVLNSKCSIEKLIAYNEADAPQPDSTEGRQ